ncbi:glycosyltransferase family 2 protein [Oscillibacter sp.]|uniref:glycosyltransferase family 2 protein n=1 Tax=Oscillibacter sp. TaxID=1945593 RepID=UPI00261FBCF6|nr:glycosyltransferase family 2 protein [Oscillibacter sp.]MDD3346472.1 glycosyltransferase family 2 protein [Oscillibacter sp.]
MRSLVMIPAYNEECNILNTIADIRRHAPEMDYIVINDCSTDHTEEILKENGIPYLNHPVNLGIGGGVQSGYRYAKDNGYDIAIQFDGDGQHEAQYLHTLIAPIETDAADFAIGSRFLENEGFQSSFLRRFGINFLSGMIHLLCGIRVNDVTSGMRAVNRSLIEAFAQDYAQDYPEPEAILAAGLKGARILEIPVQMRERQGGTSSINALRSVYYMIKVTLALFFSAMSAPRDRRKLHE